METPADLSRIVRGYEPGSRIAISYERNGRKRVTNATLGSTRDTWRFDAFDPMNAETIPMLTPPQRRLFLDSEEVDAAPKLGLTVEQNDDGVTIKKVQPNSLAAKGGFEEGDIISSLNEHNVDDVDNLKNELRSRHPARACNSS